MENHHVIHGKTHHKWPFLNGYVANYKRVFSIKPELMSIVSNPTNIICWGPLPWSQATLFGCCLATCLGLAGPDEILITKAWDFTTKHGGSTLQPSRHRDLHHPNHVGFVVGFLIRKIIYISATWKMCTAYG